MIIPILLALAVTIALAATSASSASADVLCEEPLVGSGEGETCEFPYAKGEKLEAKSSKVLLSGESFEVTCESAMTLVNGESLGDEKGLTGEISAWTLSNCKGTCSKAAWTGLPYKTTSKASKEGDGTLTAGAPEKEPSLSLEGCPFGSKCTYGAEKVVFAFDGGKPATMAATKAPAKRTSGTFCPKEGSLTSTFTYQQPGGGRAYQAARERPATVLCKVQMNPCPAGDRYGATTAFEAKVTGAGIEFKWGGWVENTCPISVIKGTTETIATPILAKITEWKFENCGPCKEAKAMRLPWIAKIERTTNGNGLLTAESGGTGDPVLEMIECSGGGSCNFYRIFPQISIEGGDPMAKFNFPNVAFFELTGGCGQMTIEAKYQIEVPKPLWVEKVAL